MEKNLENLLLSVDNYKIFGSKKILVSGINDDSRKIKKGNIFVAIKGSTFDGHSFIPQTRSLGVKVIVGEKDPKGLKLAKTTYVKVKNSRKALSLLCSAWYGNPSKKLTIIGITGTDGKTTTANLIYSILKKAKKKVGLISTINAKIDDRNYETGLHVTNLEPPLLQKFLAEMVKKKCQYAVLEVTSHGLDQQRVAGINFQVGVITNITHEHLDYHKTFENYLATKAKLFQGVKIAVLNRDDRHFDYLKRVLDKTKIVSYGIIQEGDYTLKNFKFKTKLFGKHNLYNCLAAIATTKTLGIRGGIIKKALTDFSGLPGRLERIKTEKKFQIFIDFAHTQNGLANVLETLKKTNSKSRLIVVFGCAGERDKTKRPIMGEIATKMADLVILTAEDPRTEDVNDIIDQIVVGCKKAGGVEDKTYFRIPNRGEAIKFAIKKLAKKDDTVVICGKGHEKSMCFNKTEIPWNDRKEIELTLK